MSSRVLLVDGDPRNLRVLDVSLRSAGLNVETATTGTEAWEILERATPDLVIAATELAGLDGFELCARLREAHGEARPPVILLAADKTLDQKMRILEAGADDYLVKPLYVKEVLARAVSALQRRDRERLTTAPDPGSRDIHDGADRFAGSISEITVVDLVQLIEGNGRSGIVHLRSATGAPASIYFRNGRIVDAEVARLSGTDALSRLFSWTGGNFEFEWKSIRRKDAIARPPSELVIEGMQRLDEWNRLIAQLPDPNAIFEVDYRLLAERLAEVPDEVNEILRLCDGVRTVTQVVEDSALPDVAALTAMIRLREEGIVCDMSSRRSSASSATPTRLDGWLGTGSQPFSSRPSAPPRAGRLSMGSGPVQQSFADRLDEQERSGRMQSAELAHDYPQAELDSTGAPRRHRTAPGLGQEAPDRAGEISTASKVQSFEDVIPEPRPPQHNIIKFPGSVEARAVTTARQTAEFVSPSPRSAAYKPESAPDPINTSARSGELDTASGATMASSASDTFSPTAIVPPSSASTMTTHRGIGPTSAVELRADSAVPQEVRDRSSSAAASDSGRADLPARSRAYPVAFEPDRAFPPDAPDVPDMPDVPERRGAPTSPEMSDRYAVSSFSEETARISFPDDDISRGDALDELGLPSRWRGLRFLVGVAAVGALVGLGVRTFRGRSADEAARNPNMREQAPPSPVESNQPAVTRAAGSVVPGVSPAPIAPGESATTAMENPRGEPAGKPSTGAPPVVGLTGPDEASPALTAPKGAEPIAAAESAKAASPPPAEPIPVVPPPAPPSPDVQARSGGTPGTVGQPAGTGPVSRATKVQVPEEAAPEGTPPSAATAASAAATDFPHQLAACRAAFLRGRMRDALSSCAAAVAANPGSAEALTMLAHAELNRGRLSQANELATKAIAINPNLADAYVIIGGVHQDSGQNREAKVAYRRYLQLAPQGRYADELRSIVNSL